MNPCLCPFCMPTRVVASRLPLPMRLVARHDHRAIRWAWLVGHDATGSVRVVVHQDDGTPIRCTSLTEASRGLADDSSEHDLRSLWVVQQGAKKVTLADLPPMPPFDGDTSSMYKGSGRCVEMASTTTCVKKKKRKVEPPVADEGLGGCADVVAEILDARPVWDEEAVEALLLACATPEVVKVHAVIPGRTPLLNRLLCTFRQPNGHLVEKITVLESLFYRRYPAWRLVPPTGE